jgi:hypothetical protein
MLILLMLHFLADQHRDRLVSPKASNILSSEEPDLTLIANVNRVDKESDELPLQEASTRLEDIESIERGKPFDDDGIPVVSFFTNYAADASYSLRAFIQDVVYLHIFTIDVISLQILAIGVILYGLMRPLDSPVHRFFYDSKYHKNIHQLPDRINRIAKRGLKWYRNLCMISAVLPIETEIARDTALMFVQGSMWMSLVKRGLKMLADAKHMRGARRPPNEHFIRGIYYGGFPSGHMSHSAYALTLTLISYTGSLHDQILLWGLGIHCFLAVRFHFSYHNLRLTFVPLLQFPAFLTDILYRSVG